MGTNSFSIIFVVLGAVGTLFTVIKTSAVLYSKIEVIGNSFNNLVSRIDDLIRNQEKRGDDHEQRLRALEHKVFPK